MNIDYEQAFEYFLRVIKDYKGKLPLVIAFDGRSASGKTTLAEKLGDYLRIPVIHTDDFYRPKNEFGKLEVTEFDGNFDVTRFKNEVVDGIYSKKSFKYGVFDCADGEIAEYINVAVSNCYIIEGAYSLNPNLTDYASFKVFFDISGATQKERIILRNGAEKYNKFNEIWIPCEERYINHYNIKSRCDVIVNV